MIDEVRFERIIDAPVPVVFEAFTTLGGQEAFYGRDDPNWIVASECDLRAGGVWTVSFGPAPGPRHRHRHAFRVIDRPHRLLLATTEFRADGSSIEFATEFTFTDHHRRTLMTMTQTGLPTDQLRKEHRHGVPNAFDRLERVISRANTRPGAGAPMSTVDRQ